MRMRVQQLSATAGIAVLAAGMLSFSALAATPQDVLVIGKAEDPRTLDPAVTMSNNAWSVTYPAYERLVTYKVENGQGSTEVEGELADSWEVSEDNLIWTFELGEGHFFADGTPVDADAVVFSFERLLEMEQGPSSAFPSIQSVEAVDEDTVRFTLSEPFAPFLYTLANNGAAIINPKVMEHEKDGDYAQAYLSEHTMGSGVFQVDSWEKGQQIVMTPNPHYAEAPAFKSVEIRIIKEASARRLQLENGDLDIAENLPIDQISTLKQAEGVVVG
ncbi:MAG TPA: ABC transporter substrate-binding protein, partial [Kiloniellales bacterium]|nr:ABC transporter substrate-binding protein [Kiloniellales bacterium]